MDLDVLYMQDLTHLTFSVNQRDRSDSCPHFTGKETEVTKLAKGPAGSWVHLWLPKLVLLEAQGETGPAVE